MARAPPPVYTICRDQLPPPHNPPPIVKTTVKREITLTLDESEAGQLRDLMLNCSRLWDSNQEISAKYAHTVLPELWRELNRLL